MEKNKFALLQKFKEFQKRFQQVESEMAKPEVIKERSLYQRLAKERAELSGKAENYRELDQIIKEIGRLEDIVKQGKEEKDFLLLVQEEVHILKDKQKKLFLQLEEYLLEQDKDQNKDIIVEIRAGTGGEEAALFAADLYKMYGYFATSCGFKVEVINSHPTQIGGFKEVIFSVEGNGAYSKFKFESGIHRVQRVPSTETSGRIHTSAVSVAILPEPDDVDIKINPNDLKIDVYRSTGAGGQCVNTTDSAVRMTHLPTGVVVTCQDERSQLKNKIKAMKVMRARLLDLARKTQKSKITNQRRLQVGSGDRSEKIRTYNFPDRRVTDHRINLTLYKIEQILAGNLNEIVSALQKEERRIKLSQK
ncbi:MAG: peptide chain release factor 1 [Candidatus Omnitrophota bacterium]|nr:MAG: peptide chain release factor 1 [Candidatus Omnitrophota bacterium]